MTQAEISLYIIKLVAGGITAFLAIMLWSKTWDVAWMSLVAGFIASYAGIVYNLMVDLGVFAPTKVMVLGVPLTTFLFNVIPYIFFMLAFILMLCRKR